MERCDIAIIGGGIAGLSLGKFLSERGIPFILFEEHDGFFKKACGEGFLIKTFGHDFYNLYGEKKGVEKEIYESHIHTNHGTIKLLAPIVTTNKQIIEETLAFHAQKQGEIRMGEKVKKIENGILFPQHIKPKIIVGADGLFSLVRKNIGRIPVGYSIAAEGISNSVPLNPENAHIIMKKEVVKNGFAWYFPKKDRWNIGMGSWKHSEFKPTFNRFKKENKATRWRGAFIPYNKPVQPHKKNMLLLGDAAAHVVANLGEGNMPAMIAAYIAAEVLEKSIKKEGNDNILSEYQKKCTQLFGRYLRRAYAFNRLYYLILKSEYIRYKILKKVCTAANNYYQKIT